VTTKTTQADVITIVTYLYSHETSLRLIYPGGFCFKTLEPHLRVSVCFVTEDCRQIDLHEYNDNKSIEKVRYNHHIESRANCTAFPAGAFSSRCLNGWRLEENCIRLFEKLNDPTETTKATLIITMFISVDYIHTDIHI
jgi:hypothetical protein